ncbi:nucleolin-like [Cimex lectularius]|uniref:Uncharacterized protein n=1 Tax=Cimex lectularius TaxID=79782 RepID=A0A8I6RGL2_CIMLE|nr:nucleolin-like [Cimex lectularius]
MARLTRKKPVRCDEDEFDVDDPSEVDEPQNDDGDSSPTDNSGGRRKSGRQRVLKKAYKDDGSSDDDLHDDEEDDDLDDDSEEEKLETPKKKVDKKKTAKPAGRGRTRGKPPAKKSKLDEENEESDDIDGEESEGDAADTPLEYRSGCFVVLKSDVDNGVEDHPLWKIDGKSLLQKYDKTMKDDEVYYKSTTTYAGWSKSVMDTYYPIKVEFEKNDSCNGTYVKFSANQLEQLKKLKATESKVEKEEEENDN